jgi:hypothetical protein
MIEEKQVFFIRISHVHWIVMCRTHSDFIESSRKFIFNNRICKTKVSEEIKFLSQIMYKLFVVKKEKSKS